MEIHLRPLLPSDREEFTRVLAYSEPLHAPWNPTRPPGDTWDAMFDRQIASVADGRSWKGVAELPDGRIGGFFSLSEIVRGVFQSAYAGWSVNAEVGGRGVATAGVRALVNFALSPEGLGLHRVQANINPRNIASVRVAEKVGFRQEGLALRYLQIAGVWEDHAMYALTVEDLPLRT